MEVMIGVAFSLAVVVVLVFLGFRERRTHREEIEFFKASGWEEVYRVPRHYWWHSATNRAIHFGDYAKDKQGVKRLVEKAAVAARKKQR